MKITILTGAGISAESGIRTFREGLWEGKTISEVSSNDSDPKLVSAFYNDLEQQIIRAKPNAAHFAITKLTKHHQVTLITQNVDDLHEKAGSQPLHLHGEIGSVVLYGDEPKHLSHIYNVLPQSELFLSIGTSNNTYPAASFVSFAKNAKRIEFNTNKTELSHKFDLHINGPASVTVPEWTMNFLRGK